MPTVRPTFELERYGGTPKPRPQIPYYYLSGENGTCARCAKTVYANEICAAKAHFEAYPRAYHQQCFRCRDCETKLRVDNWEIEASSGDLLCKTHFIARQNRNS